MNEVNFMDYKESYELWLKNVNAEQLKESNLSLYCISAV